jgi:hypothetical protein
MPLEKNQPHWQKFDQSGHPGCQIICFKIGLKRAAPTHVRKADFLVVNHWAIL